MSEALVLVVFFALLALLEGTQPSFYVMDCDSSINAIDRAKVYIEPTSAANNLALYVINDECYKCSKSFVGAFPAVGSSAYCVAFFTPFPWKMYLASQNDPTTILNEKTYTFGDHGYYNLAISDNSELVVTETKAPENIMQPLFILIGVMIAVAFLSFTCPPLYDRLKKRHRKCNKEEYLPVHLSVPGEDNDISLKQITGEEMKIGNNGVSNALTAALVPPSDKTDRQSSATIAGKSVPKNQKKKLPRLQSLDTFRGISLTFMIFVNYGGGGYWFFEHAAWNGLTIADLLFPWFMWIMGVSMAISFHNILPADTRSAEYEKEYFSVWFKAAQRAVTLFLIGMFLANGYEYTTWRVPGVLQYFACAYGVTSATILLFYRRTKDALQVEESLYEDYLSQRGIVRMAIGDNETHKSVSEWLQWFHNTIRPAKILWAYRYEWIIQAILLLFYLIMHLGVPAPGCPAGYAGAGGLSEESKYEFCTGGIHRYLDMKLFGYKFIYHHPTCLEIYQCRPYDPEGFLGVWSACTLCYLGLMAGRIVLHAKEHTQRLLYWAMSAFAWCLLAGILCGFSKDEGAIPINKNMWTTSFILLTAGLGLVGLSFCYCTIDVAKLWTGAPFLYMGMNSIMIYVGHGILEGYMPFSYMLTNQNHAAKLQMNVFGVLSWILIAFYCYKIKFFVKV